MWGFQLEKSIYKFVHIKTNKKATPKSKTAYSPTAV
jgi:hypothetical protein